MLAAAAASPRNAAWAPRSRSCQPLQPGSATSTPGAPGLNPLNRSQKLSAISKIAIGVSNHQSLTTLLKVGKRSEEHTSELQSRSDLVCRLLLEKKKKHRSTDCTT